MKHVKVKQIPSFTAKAPKLRGAGEIDYVLWVDDNGSLYVQFRDNTHSGVFSGLLFSVSQYASKRNSDKSINQLNGYDVNAKCWVTHTGNNNGGFLKAVLRHLLP